MPVEKVELERDERISKDDNRGYPSMSGFHNWCFAGDEE